MCMSGRGSVSVDDVDLAHAHRGDGGVVRCGCDARAALCVQRDGHFGVERLFYQRVRYDADVGAETDDLHMDVRLTVLRDIFADDLYKFGRAEGGLMDDRGVFRHSGLHRIIQLPALSVLHAVDEREVDALLRFKIGFLVRVLRGDDRIAAGLVFVDLGYNVRDDGLRLGGAERLIDEVLLHIDDKENVHGFSLRVGCGGFLADF